MDALTILLYNSNMAKVQQSTLIPNYNLYGEIGDLPDVVHCESIAARSILHDWQIKPHRHLRLHQFFIILSGGGKYQIDDRVIELKPQQVLTIPPQTVHGFTFETGTEGWVITIPMEIIDEGVRDYLFQHLALPGEISADQTLISLFNEVAVEHSERRFARAHVLRALTMLIAGKIIRTIVETNEDNNNNSVSPILRQFEILLEEHYRDHWKLGDYSDALAITSTHLSRLTREQTGMPASKLIEDRLIREARRNLAYTRLTISEIAYRIGFSDPAYFTRVFSRATGISPSTFRTRLD
ncbi:MAG: helix-turn-helix domain-containing protein [Rhizobiaceae bacterium]|nr:helix-turn-helix domain-containing protein [Rhizobiaceae bacterium]